MTNEELLQQAKDQVAKDAKYASWSGLESICLSANASAAHRILYSSYIHKAAELAIQSAREEGVPKWIPVKERLPQRYEDLCTSETVLVYTTSTHIFMGYYNHKVNGWEIIGDEAISEIHIVTHWMPKPEIPI